MVRSRQSNVAELHLIPEPVLESQFGTLNAKIPATECHTKNLVSKYARDDISTKLLLSGPNFNQDIVKLRSYDVILILGIQLCCIPNPHICRYLGECLNIEDHKTNLVTCWMLRAINHQVMTFPKEIYEEDYEISIRWLREAITLIDKYPDMSREDYFGLLGKIFHESVFSTRKQNKIVFPSEFIHRQEIESDLEIPIYDDDSDKSVIDGGVEEASDTQPLKIEAKNNCGERFYESLLYYLIEAIYQIVGDEMNFNLVKYAFTSGKDIQHYKIPYHFRKPRITKKLIGSMEKSSIPSHSKLDKTKKRRKSSKKLISVDESRRSISDYASNAQRFILPLSEAIESYEIIQGEQSRT